MKVGEVGGKESVVQGARDSSGKVGKGTEDFKNYLNVSSPSSQAAESTKAPASGVEATEMNPVLALNHTLDNSGVSAASDTVATAVTQAGQELDQVADTLESGKIGLQAVGKAIDTLSEQANSLQQTVKELPSDHPLRKVGDELNVLAYTESVKWQRGDYV